MDRETGRSKGVGKIDFASEEAQQKAIDEWHDSELDGRTISVREFGGKGEGGKGGGESGGGKGKGGGKGGSSGGSSNSVFVAGLSLDTTSEGLMAHFEECGEILKANVYEDRDSGKSRGVAKIDFATEE